MTCAGGLRAERGVQVCLISEPNARRVQDRQDWFIDRTGCTAVWWFDESGSRETVRAKGEEAGFSWIELGKGVVIYSCYFSPNRNDTEFSDSLGTLGVSIESVIATGDFNAAAGEWGSTRNTVRGRNLLDWMAQRDLTLLNDGRIPTFMSPSSRKCSLILPWQPVYWWSDEIAETRRRCKRLRRAYTRRRTWLSRRHIRDLTSIATDR